MSELIITHALTLWQPWPYAIFELGKDLENREWKTKFRGWLGIHASKARPRDEYGYMADQIKSICGKFPPQLDYVPHGALVGAVWVNGCVSQSDSPWFLDDYGWTFTEKVKLAQPMPMHGSHSIWKLPQPLRIDRETGVTL